MSSTGSWRTSISAGLLLLSGCVFQPPAVRTPLFQDDFKSLEYWTVECEKPSRVVAANGVLDIDTPAGCTVWFKLNLEGPLEIDFDATAVAEGGANDQVSDLNVFWMARNRDGTAPFSTPRSGKFEAYNDLFTYYVGLGGNRNSTTRFRRYIGDPVQRPLLPGHDLDKPDVLLLPNHRQTIRLIANGQRIEFHRDSRILFQFDDPVPYVQGWFAFRTTYSHLRIERLRIYTLTSASNSR